MKRLLYLFLLLASLPALASEDVLHVYNWNDYIAPETVERFEKFCSCKVKQSYFSDNEELMAKLNAGAKGYDVMVPTSNYVTGMAKQGWLQPHRPRQGAESQEHHAAVSEHRIRPGQQVLRALCHVDHADRLQRAEDQGARRSGGLVGDDLRSQDPGEDQRPGHRAGQPERADGRRAQVPRATR